MARYAWTWNDDVELTLAQIDARRPILDNLMAQIRAIEEPREIRGFIEDDEYAQPEFDSDEEREAHCALMDAKYAAQEAQIEALESAMQGLGARREGLYEHWNEDAQYMAWAEAD